MRAALVWLVLTTGCGARATEPTTPESVVREASPPDRIVRGDTGQRIELAEMVSELAQAKVVYLGERHDRAEDHAMQHLLIRALRHENPNLGIGMEMFQRPFQDALDLWSAGELDESELRRRTEWDQRWGFDFGIYRPILELIRSRHIASFALNAPKEITRQVARQGIESLSEEQRESLPELDLDNAAHRALVAEALGGHAHAMEPQTLERFYTAQVIWDETMAQSVGDALASPEAPAQLVVLAGGMHIQAGLGIPIRAARRGASPFKTVIVIEPSDLDEWLSTEPQPADYYWIP